MFAGYVTFGVPQTYNPTFTQPFMPAVTLNQLPIKVVFFASSFTHTIQPNILNPQPISFDPFNCKQVTLQENLSSGFPNLFGNAPVPVYDHVNNGKLYEIFWLAPNQYGAVAVNGITANDHSLVAVAEVDPSYITTMPLPPFITANWQGWTPISYYHPGVGNCGVMVNRNHPLSTTVNYQGQSYLMLPVGSSFIATDSSGQAIHYYISTAQNQGLQGQISFVSLDSYASMLYTPSLNQYQLPVTQSTAFGGSLSGILPILSGNLPVYLLSGNPLIVIIPYGNYNGITIY